MTHKPPRTGEGGGVSGTFADLEMLLEQIGDAPIIELGRPLPDDRHLPSTRRRVTLAQVNQLLFDEAAGDRGSG